MNNITRFALAASVLGNLTLASIWYNNNKAALADDQEYTELAARHETLVQWACAHGNGGWECNEE